MHGYYIFLYIGVPPSDEERNVVFCVYYGAELQKNIFPISKKKERFLKFLEVRKALPLYFYKKRREKIIPSSYENNT